jgi:hypothetical protein
MKLQKHNASKPNHLYVVRWVDVDGKERVLDGVLFDTARVIAQDNYDKFRIITTITKAA